MFHLHTFSLEKPKTLMEASVWIWKKRSELGPLSTGVETSFSFEASNAFCHFVVQRNSASFVRRTNRGAALLLKS
jgi:hypothetical protein